MVVGSLLSLVCSSFSPSSSPCVRIKADGEMTVTVERKGWKLSNLDRCKEEGTAIARSSVSV